MSTHLFFNIVTAFVNAWFVMISEFFNAGKPEQFQRHLQPSTVVDLSSGSGENLCPRSVFSSNLETGGNPWENTVDDAFLQILIQIGLL